MLAAALHTKVNDYFLGHVGLSDGDDHMLVAHCQHGLSCGDLAQVLATQNGEDVDPTQEQIRGFISENGLVSMRISLLVLSWAMLATTIFSLLGCTNAPGDQVATSSLTTGEVVDDRAVDIIGTEESAEPPTLTPEQIDSDSDHDAIEPEPSTRPTLEVSNTPAATETSQLAPHPTAEAEPTQDVFEVNFREAIETARVQYPAFGPGFDELRNETYPLFVYVVDEEGNPQRHYLETESNLNFEMREDDLWATFSFENEAETFEMKWFPVDIPGVEIPGYWAVKQFETSLVEHFVGFDAFNMKNYIQSERSIQFPYRDIIRVRLEANTETVDPNQGAFLGSTREEVLAYARSVNWALPEDFLLVQPPFDGVNVEQAYNRPVFHTFANAWFGVGSATPEQIEAITAYYHGTANAEQTALVESTEHFQRTGRLQINDFYLGGQGTRPLIFVLQALPFEGEATRESIISYPTSPPLNRLSIDNKGRAVIRITTADSWITQFHSIRDLALYLGLQPDRYDTEHSGATTPIYNYLDENFIMAELKSDKGESVIVPLDLTATEKK